MAKTKQVTIYMTVQTRARDKTIERQIKMGLRREVAGSYDVQQVLVEDVLDESNDRIRLSQLSTRLDRLLEDVEEIGDNALQRLEERCRIVEEFTKPEEVKSE